MTASSCQVWWARQRSGWGGAASLALCCASAGNCWTDESGKSCQNTKRPNPWSGLLRLRTFFGSPNLSSLRVLANRGSCYAVALANVGSTHSARAGGGSSPYWTLIFALHMLTASFAVDSLGAARFTVTLLVAIGRLSLVAETWVALTLVRLAFLVAAGSLIRDFFSIDISCSSILFLIS